MKIKTKQLSYDEVMKIKKRLCKKTKALRKCF